MSSDDGLLK